jgi:hypothetical protein
MRKKSLETTCGRSLMVDLRVSARTGTALAGLFAAAISVPAFAVEAPAPDISGIYWARVYNPKLQIVGGGGLPLTAEGRATYEKNAKGLNDGSIPDNARKLCVPDGLPRVLATPYPFEIVQAPPGQVTMIYELNHQVRMIALDKPLPSKDDLEIFPFYNGHSVGKYEGDTLVVTSAGFKDNPITLLDATGAPHTDEMTTTERIRKISPTQLEDVITIHDPKYYSRDFQVRFVYAQRNDVRLEDYVCGEPHRDIYGIPGVRKP